MKYILVALAIALTGCNDTVKTLETEMNQEAIIVEGSLQHCAHTTTAIAWDDDGQDYVITYCSCPITYDGVGPQECRKGEM